MSPRHRRSIAESASALWFHRNATIRAPVPIAGVRRQTADTCVTLDGLNRTLTFAPNIVQAASNVVYGHAGSPDFHRAEDVGVPPRCGGYRGWALHRRQVAIASVGDSPRTCYSRVERCR